MIQNNVKIQNIVFSLVGPLHFRQFYEENVFHQFVKYLVLPPMHLLMQMWIVV